MGQEHPNTVASGKAEYPTEMIAVFVGDEKAAQVFGTQTQPRQTRYGFAAVEAAIDQNPGGVPPIADLDDQSVAPAATTETSETNHLNCS